MVVILEGQLDRIKIKGYKSIKECDLNLKSLNVLIGCNGAGKSNFISSERGEFHEPGLQKGQIFFLEA